MFDSLFDLNAIRWIVGGLVFGILFFVKNFNNFVRSTIAETKRTEKLIDNLKDEIQDLKATQSTLVRTVDFLEKELVTDEMKIKRMVSNGLPEEYARDSISGYYESFVDENK